MISSDVQSHKLIQQGLCPECGSHDFITDSETGEVTCIRCGMVLQDEVVTQSPEWRAFTPGERDRKVRVGAPTSLMQFDRGLSTTFQPYKDTHGKSLPIKERVKMMRLRKWNIRARMHSSEERNLSQAMNVLTQFSDKLRIPPNVEENAALIYRRALDRQLVRGRSIEGMAAASVYAACRLTRTPRSLTEIVDISPRKRKEISRCYRLLQRELVISMPVDDPIKYVAQIASKVGLTQQTQNLAIELLHKAQKVNDLVGKSPAGSAAAALYIATLMKSERVTQKELADAANVTEVTVRNRYRGLDNNLGLRLRKSPARD